MKLFTRIVRRFYSVEWKTSEQQLLDDFGEFPPAPLRCDSLKGGFKLIRTSGVGSLYNDLVLQKAALNALFLDPQSLSKEMMASLGAEYISETQREIYAFSGDGVFRMRIVRIMISIVFCFKSLQIITRAILFRPKRPNVLGAFIPVSKNESQISIETGRLLKRQRSEASIVSHEHIHLLQHRIPEDHSMHVQAPEDLLTEKGLSKYLLYVLEKKEVEARLHECVLSFYQVHRQLPLNTSGFLGLLASSRDFGPYYSGILELVGGTVVEIKEYSERDALFVEELSWILVHIKTNELKYRFITEVLTVMYGNLLKYYGDPVASKSFLEGVARPNLYDDLYSAQTV